jgi:hypothetical protein
MESGGAVTDRGAGVFRALAGDIADWGERFRRVYADWGEDAARQVLGGVAEWLGTDLVDGMPTIPLERWQRLDSLAEELLLACRACLARANGAEERLETVIDRAKRLL